MTSAGTNCVVEVNTLLFTLVRFCPYSRRSRHPSRYARSIELRYAGFSKPQQRGAHVRAAEVSGCCWTGCKVSGVGGASLQEGVVAADRHWYRKRKLNCSAARGRAGPPTAPYGLWNIGDGLSESALVAGSVSSADCRKQCRGVGLLAVVPGSPALRRQARSITAITDVIDRAPGSRPVVPKPTLPSTPRSKRSPGRCSSLPGNRPVHCKRWPNHWRLPTELVIGQGSEVNELGEQYSGTLLMPGW